LQQQFKSYSKQTKGQKNDFIVFCFNGTKQLENYQGGPENMPCFAMSTRKKLFKKGFFLTFDVL